MMPAIEVTERRVVFRHADGLHRIMNVVTGQPPERVQGSVEWSLVSCKPRYYLYRESVKPEGLGTFNEAQR
jgi:hypothetical protein